jgi:TPR repeat protein
MQSSRTPDRVHVVQRPQNDDLRSPSSEIARTLAQINDKLKRSEAERYELLAELREYRKALSALEDKSDASEKAFLTLEHKIQTRDKLETELTQRQARFEKSLRDTEEKLIKSVANQAVLDKKMRDTEERHMALTVRIDDAASEQARMNLQIEKVADDKSRMLRKVDRLELVIQETQEALKARAMVLLTDQSAAAQSGLKQIPAWSDAQAANDEAAAEDPWWRRTVKIQSVGMGAMVAAALLLGWTINQMQQPAVPQIAVLEGGGMARLNFAEGKWEPIATPTAEISSAPASVSQSAQEVIESVDLQPAAPVAEVRGDEALTLEVQNASGAATVLDADDQALLDAMEADPDALAGELNALEPGAAQMSVPDETPATDSSDSISQSSTIMPDFEQMAFEQDADIARAVAAERDVRPLAERLAADTALPGPAKVMERQAFAGTAAAQHDLAAIYTAGHAGVSQNFERAAFWFREAAENGIANARYNLGVLYHQGLGVERDLGRALYWYREAAMLNHPEAQYNLGIAHIEGIGTDYDPLLAAAYFERAAVQGIMEAAYNLGLIYENGLLGDPDQDEALFWYQTAADQGSADARQALRTLTTAMGLSEAEAAERVARMKQDRAILQPASTR